MNTLSFVSIAGARAIDTLSPDSGELSLILEDANCINDANDPPKQIEPLSIDITVKLNVETPGFLTNNPNSTAQIYFDSLDVAFAEPIQRS